MAFLPAVVRRDIHRMFKRLADTIAGGLSSRFPPDKIDFGAALGAGPQGLPAVTRLAIGVNPTDGDQFTIDTATFQFVTSLGAAASYHQIKIGVNALASLATAINAINGTIDINVVPATAAFTVPVVASADGGFLRVALATRRGGEETSINSPPPDIEFTAGLAANVTWTQTTFLMSRDQMQGQWTIFTVRLENFHFVNGGVTVELPFTPTTDQPLLTVYNAAGAQVVRDEPITFSGNLLRLILAGGGAPHYQIGDRLVLMVAAY